jgi:hypothetical protein
MTPPPNPYAPPRSDEEMAGPPVAGDLTREDIYAFAGQRRGGYYWYHWSRAGAGRGFAGFNWAAAIFNLSWLLYRRMYVEFGVGLGVTGTITVAEVLLQPVLGKEVAQLLSRLDNFLPVVVVGFLGNRLYLRRARAAVALARPLATPADRHAFLAARGGTSWLAVFVGLVLSLGMFAVLVAVLGKDR